MKTFEDFGIYLNGSESDETRTTCPECSPSRKKKKDKCLSVNVDEGVWFCHHCEWTGGLNNGDDIKLSVVPPLPKPVKKPEFEYSSDLPEEAYDFLVDERCIPEQVLKRNKVCFKDGAIQFPYFRDGEVVNIKHRTLDKRFWQSGGAEKVVYGFDDIAGDKLIWVEGELDKLAVEVAGFRSCVSVPDGAPSPGAKSYTSKFNFLENCEEKLETINTHLIAVDNDEPGKKLQNELARRLGVEKCSLVRWPKGCKDANEVLIQCGIEELKKCIENSKPFPIQGLFEVSDIIDGILSFYDNGAEGGIPVEWPSMQKLYSVKPGEWSLVTGIPSHGKSEFIDALMIGLAENHGWKFGVCSPENQPLSQHAAKMIEKYSRKPFRPGIRGRIDSKELIPSIGWLDEHFSFILPDENNLTVDGVLRLAKALVFRKGIRGLVIDPWNELDHSRPPNLSETEYISQSLTKIRRFARTNGIHIWVVAHPTKLLKGSDGDYPVPTPYDVAGSAHWRNKADNCISIWRDLSKTEDREVQVHVQKIRFKEVGRIGVTSLFYDPVTGRYNDCPI